MISLVQSQNYLLFVELLYKSNTTQLSAVGCAVSLVHTSASHQC